jgi:hypothetical protein
MRPIMIFLLSAAALDRRPAWAGVVARPAEDTVAAVIPLAQSSVLPDSCRTPPHGR